MKLFLLVSLLFFISFNLNSCKCKAPSIGEVSLENNENQLDELSESIDFITILSGEHSNMMKPNQVIIRDEESLKLLYKKLNETFFPPIQVPKIDFEKNIFLALYMGSRTSGGFSINVDHITASQSKLLVYYNENGPQSMATAVMTQPFCLVKIERTELPIHFQKR